MHANRYAELGTGIVNRIIFRTGESTIAKFVGPPENSHKPQFLTSIFQFRHGTHRILQRQKHYAVQSLAVIIAIVGEPSIIGDRKSTRLNSSHMSISYA